MSVFNERLKTLSNLTRKSARSISDATGIPISTVSSYLSGRVHWTSLEDAIKLADYFAVPLDYLAGRTASPLTPVASESDIGKHAYAGFSDLERSIIERDLKNHPLPVSRLKRVMKVSESTEAPYPYNLLADICSVFDAQDNRNIVRMPITEDQMNGLNQAVSSLTEKEQTVVTYLYHDGLTLEEAGVIFGVTRERIRQLNAKAIRKLRHPSRYNLIRYGIRGYGLKKQKDALRYREKELQTFAKQLNATETRLMKQASALGKPLDAVIPVNPVSIESMNLSVRTYTCLKRAGYNTLDDILKTYDEKGPDAFMRIRNLGRKSFDDLVTHVKAICGVDLTRYKEKHTYGTHF